MQSALTDPKSGQARQQRHASEKVDPPPLHPHPPPPPPSQLLGICTQAAAMQRGNHVSTLAGQMLSERRRKRLLKRSREPAAWPVGGTSLHYYINRLATKVPMVRGPPLVSLSAAIARIADCGAWVSLLIDQKQRAWMWRSNCTCDP